MGDFMDLLVAFGVFFAALAVALRMGVSMIVPLAVGLACFVIVGLRRGFSLRSLTGMALSGAKRSLIVLRVFLLIGLITALWRASGVIAFFVAQGIAVITPTLFVLIAFLLSALLAYALGTSFGIVGTVGVIMMALARSGGVSEVVAAGAVLSGAYFGDRGAPTSSSANLVAAVTGTKLFDNVRLMLRTAALPFGLCTVFYLALSQAHPLNAVDPALVGMLHENFRLSWWLLLPVVLMLALPFFKVEVRHAMLCSIVCAFALTVFVQRATVWETLRVCLLGYHPENEALARIFAGGGLVSMLSVAGIVLLSCTYAGIFDGTGMLDGVRARVTALSERIGLFSAACVVSTATCAAFCNQTIGVVLTDALVEPAYTQRGRSAVERAQDLESSVILIAGLVPWSIACAAPLGMLGVGYGALPYAAFLYATPICYGLTKRWFFKA